MRAVAPTPSTKLKGKARAGLRPNDEPTRKLIIAFPRYAVRESMKRILKLIVNGLPTVVQSAVLDLQRWAMRPKRPRECAVPLNGLSKRLTEPYAVPNRSWSGHVRRDQNHPPPARRKGATGRLPSGTVRPQAHSQSVPCRHPRSASLASRTKRRPGAPHSRHRYPLFPNPNLGP
jgi:hypothetical protein